VNRRCEKRPPIPERCLHISVIGRIGLRRVLPVQLTLIHVALLYFAAEQTVDTSSRVWSEFAYHLAAYRVESSVGWERMGPKPLTSAQKTRYFAQSSGNNPRDSNRTGVLSRHVVVSGRAVRAPPCGLALDGGSIGC